MDCIIAAAVLLRQKTASKTKYCKGEKQQQVAFSAGKNHRFQGAAGLQGKPAATEAAKEQQQQVAAGREEEEEEER